MDSKKILEMFEYLTSIETEKLEPADGAFVFCRADPLVAQRVAELFEEKLIDYAMFTGGIGKDSGALPNLELAEAVYQAALARWKYNIPDNKIYVEPTATNGAENTRKGIDVIVKNNLPHDDLIIVIHPTTLRRILSTHAKIADNIGFTAKYQLTGTHYTFNPNNHIDQKEAVGEMLRLADWPEKGWGYPQPDLPEDLVDYARNVSNSIL